MWHIRIHQGQVENFRSGEVPAVIVTERKMENWINIFDCSQSVTVRL